MGHREFEDKNRAASFPEILRLLCLRKFCPKKKEERSVPSFGFEICLQKVEHLEKLGHSFDSVFAFKNQKLNKPTHNVIFNAHLTLYGCYGH